MPSLKSILAALATASLATAIQLDVTDPASIKSASSTIIYDMLKTWYNGNTSSVPSNYGTLPMPYYWWEAGAMWGGLVDYSHYTGDSSYDETTAQAIVSQASNTTNFMMLATEAFDLGNDDMLFWTLTALNAAEYNFHVPAGQPQDIYFQLSRNVFNLMVSRWNTTTCAGGLKWQWIPSNNGFYYKSTITNSAFFQVAARLGRMTGNQTYYDWANKAYDWMEAVGFVDSNYNVYDGAGDAGTANCTGVDKHQWSYNVGSTLAGAAYMYNGTGNSIWRTRALGYLNNIQANFVQPYSNATNIMYERCESSKCNNDQISFKAYLAQCLGKSAIVLPEITSAVTTILQTSAQAAAKTCTGGSTGRFCGMKWYVGGWDGSQGLGQQMTAFETISSLLVWSVGGPLKRSDSGALPQNTTSTLSATAAPTTTASTLSTIVVTTSSSVTSSASAAATTAAQKGNSAGSESNDGYFGTGQDPCACVRIN